ncbi:MAG TPA: hypothetical protein VF599_00665 [Pyrinomonadaceae bacterium]|jgi:uncharacterized membrane protein YvbJ
MADRTTNRGDEEPIKKPISKATLLMIAAAVLFLIIAGVLVIRFLNAPTGTP